MSNETRLTAPRYKVVPVADAKGKRAAGFQAFTKDMAIRTAVEWCKQLNSGFRPDDRIRWDLRDGDTVAIIDTQAPVEERRPCAGWVEKCHRSGNTTLISRGLYDGDGRWIASADAFDPPPNDEKPHWFLSDLNTKGDADTLDAACIAAEDEVRKRSAAALDVLGKS